MTMNQNSLPAENAVKDKTLVMNKKGSVPPYRDGVDMIMAAIFPQYYGTQSEKAQAKKESKKSTEKEDVKMERSLRKLGYTATIVKGRTFTNKDGKTGVKEFTPVPHEEGYVVVDCVGKDGKTFQLVGKINHDYTVTKGSNGRVYPVQKNTIKSIFKITDDRNGKTFFKEIPDGDEPVMEKFENVLNKK